MKITFTLPQRLGGFAAMKGRANERAAVTVSEALTTDDGPVFIHRIESLHGTVFSRIPGLPHPSQIHHLLILIKPNLEAVAYVNELTERVHSRLNRAIKKGELVLEQDIADIDSLDVGVEIPNDCGVIFVRSLRWQRSLFYDFGPVIDVTQPRNYDVKKAFGKLAMSLIKSAPADVPRLPKIESVKAALVELDMYLREKLSDESRYQEFLEQNPWILGAHHSAIDRHTSLDDGNIPDFTAVRSRDDCRDVIEIKQPFLPLFKQDGGFAASFNDTWNQAERYLQFCRENRDYLLRQKGLGFANPHCFIIAGHGLTDQQKRAIQDKQSHNPAITFLTYEGLLALGNNVLALLEPKKS